MDRINNIVEIAGSSNHFPAFLSILVGLILLKKEAPFFAIDTEAPGDNMPTTLIEGMGR